MVRPEAESDITEAALWYEDRDAGLGLQLTAEIRAAIQCVLQNPRGYPCQRQRPEVRRILSLRFPYRVFYIVRDQTIVVFAVLHAARHDRHWQRRV